MAKKFHVYSKMAAPVQYCGYEGGSDTPQRISTKVLIKGGAGVANKNIITPLGVHTEITAEEKDLLMANGIFRMHLEKGFVTIEEKYEDPDVVATNLTDGPDPSAPLTPADYENVPETAAIPETVKRGRKK